jgi:UDP-glucose 4-epimerase
VRITAAHETGDVTLAQSSVLVTGATGFIGGHLVARLIDLGTQVHAVCRQPAVRMPDDWGAQWWQCDVTDAAATAQLVGQVAPDVIVHLASEVAGARDHRMVLPTMHANLASVVHLLTAAMELPTTRVLLAGSMEEPAPGMIPSSPYAAAKVAATGYARMFHDLWQLPVTTLRIAMAYGPAQRDRSKLVPYTITSLLRGVPPQLTSGQRKIDWVYVGDVIDAFVATMNTPSSAGTVLQIGSGTAVSIRDTVDRLVLLAGADVQPQYGVVSDRPLDAAKIANPAEAEAVIGWLPATSLDEGLARTVEWFRAHP